MRLSLLLLLAGCLPDSKIPEDTGGDDLDTGDTAADTDDTEETGDTQETGDTDETGDPTPELVGVVVDATGFDGTTRGRIQLRAMAQFSDGSERDVTPDVDFVSSDPDVLRIVDGTGHPVDGGHADVTWSYVSYGDTVGWDFTVAAPIAGDLVFNEVLADGTVEGDPNADGSLDSVEDEYLEIANLSDVTVDLSGVTIVEDDFPYLPRHTFAAGTVLRAGEAVVVFGGGDVTNLAAANVQFFVAENEDPGIPYGLSMNNTGETVWVMAADGTTVLATVAYGDGTDNDAITDAALVLSPDVYGASYTHHAYATGSAGDFSPGTYVDGSAFPGVDGRIGG